MGGEENIPTVPRSMSLPVQYVIRLNPAIISQRVHRETRSRQQRSRSLDPIVLVVFVHPSHSRALPWLRDLRWPNTDTTGQTGAGRSCPREAIPCSARCQRKSTRRSVEKVIAACLFGTGPSVSRRDGGEAARCADERSRPAQVSACRWRGRGDSLVMGAL